MMMFKLQLCFSIKCIEIPKWLSLIEIYNPTRNEKEI